MADTQKSTGIKNGTLVPRPYSQLTAIQQAYVDFKALGGVITDDDGIRKMSVDELASKMGVTRFAFYSAVKYMPNFDDLVAERRKELASKSRLSEVHKVWYLKAVKGEWQHMDAWLRNFDPGYKPANVKVEHEMSDGMADALNLARERIRQIGNIQEGEVVDVRQTDN